MQLNRPRCSVFGRSAPRRRVGSAVAFSLAALALCVPASARAHGSPPSGGRVVFDPADSANMWLRTTFGIIESEDAGASWRWICAEGVGYDANTIDPPIGLFAGGAAAVGLSAGLATTADRCDFTPVATIAGHFVVDLVVDSAGTRAVALSTDALGVNDYDVRLWSSDDGGQTWSALGVSPPSDLLALSLSVSPVDPQRIYLAGRDGVSLYQPVIHRSDDGGQTWTRHALPAPKERLAYASIPHPSEVDTLYVGIHEMTEYFGVFRSSDGGQSFAPVFELNSVFGSFALSPDGGTLVAGGPVAGLWRSPTAAIAFTQIGQQVIRCLDWQPHGLYACGEPIVDGYLLAVSQDHGATFTPIAERSSPCGPPERCDATTSVGMTCPALWPTEQRELGACPDATGGTGGEAGGGHGGEAGNPLSGGRSGGSGGDDGDSASSCRCALVPRAPGHDWLLAIAWCCAWRRRRG